MRELEESPERELDPVVARAEDEDCEERPPVELEPDVPREDPVLCETLDPQASDRDVPDEDGARSPTSPALPTGGAAVLTG